jgi:hypothetical protein
MGVSQWSCRRTHRRKGNRRENITSRITWPIVFKNAKAYARACDVCQGVGKPSRHDELPLYHVQAPEAFEKWVVNFIGLIHPPCKAFKGKIHYYRKRLLELLGGSI